MTSTVGQALVYLILKEAATRSAFSFPKKRTANFNAIRFGAVLENVVLNQNTKVADYNDNSLTENTRAAYSIDSIDNTVLPSVAGHPTAIVF